MSEKHVSHTTGQPKPPVGMDDKYAYRIAVGAIGFALVAFLIGAAWIASKGDPVPTQYWSTGSAIAGALLGILAPTPQRRPSAKKAQLKGRLVRTRTVAAEILDVGKDLWANRALLILMTVFAVSVTFAITHHSAPLETVAATAGGALIGLLAPPPGQQSAQP